MQPSATDLPKKSASLPVTVLVRSMTRHCRGENESEDSMKRLRGPQGSKVNLTIVRRGVQDPYCSQ
nr:hypothetical protein [Bacteroides xylanisolvens]